MALPDIGRLTQDQTAELAIECLAMLPLDAKIKAILAACPAGSADRDELLAWLTD
jgi:hypothetical protein